MFILTQTSNYEDVYVTKENLKTFIVTWPQCINKNSVIIYCQSTIGDWKIHICWKNINARLSSLDNASGGLSSGNKSLGYNIKNTRLGRNDFSLVGHSLLNTKHLFSSTHKSCKLETLLVRFSFCLYVWDRVALGSFGACPDTISCTSGWPRT